MKIAIFTDSFHPQINGVVTSIIDLSKGMTDKGHKVYIIAPEYKEGIEEFSYKDIEVLRVPAIDASFYEGFKWSTIMHKPSFKKLKKANIDIVHFMTPVTISIFGILVGKMLKKPIIGTYHTFISELTYLRQLWPHAGTFAQKFSWQYTNAFYNRAHLITIPTENAKKELIKNRCKVDIEVVSNGIRLDSFDNSKAKEIKAKYNPDGHIVLYVGRIAPEKNMPVLLDAYNRVCKVDSTTKFLVVGGGPTLDLCKTIAKGYGIEDRVIFTGSIKSDELKKSGIFGACRMFVTASTTETQSITVLEAEANAIPCIGPDSKGIPNVIEHNVNGFVVEPDSAEELAQGILKLLKDDELHSTFSKNALESTKAHDLNKIIDEWETRYMRVSQIEVTRLPRIKPIIKRINY
ncbi:MAG: glycosyltransferase [Spirochaetales bacterium]|nr:glycosyltransferase [Spirochaetales bacterium]